MHLLRVVASCVVLLGALCARHAPVRAESYNENIFGDLSSNPAEPDPLPVTHGFNSVTATIGGGDIDVLKVTVPQYHRVDSITLGSYSGASQSFIGMQAGATWTAGVGNAINPALLMGWTHFGTAVGGASVGHDLLDELATPNSGSSGFARPLGPGVYAVLLQDTGGPVDFLIRFNVTYDLKPVGDFNGDFLINQNDLAKWRQDFGPASSGSDADGDGDSDGADFVIWQRNLGRLDFGISAVPEPSGMLIAAMALHGAGALRRRSTPATV